MIQYQTFGGYLAVVVPDKTYGAIIKCKGVTGSLSQLEAWLLNHKKNNFETYYFGFGDKRSPIVLEPTGMVKIACLQEEYQSFKNKIGALIHEFS